MFTEALEVGDIPKPIAERPELDSELQFIYNGYFEVGRPSGMGGGPAFMDRIFWFDYYEITNELDREFILSCWRALRPIDDELSKDLSEREGKAKQRGKTGPKSPTMGSGHVR